MPKTGKLRRDGPEAAALARFRRLTSQPASLDYYFGGNRLAAFAASLSGPLPIARMPEFRHEASLLKLGNRPEDLTAPFRQSGRGR